MTARWWAMAMASGLTIAVAGSASVIQPSGEREIPDVLIEDLRAGAVVEQYLARLLSEVRSADRTGDGLDREDVALLRAQQAARARASAVHEVLGFDLNGDLVVRREELVRAAPGDPRHRERQVQSILDRFDGNGDGAVTLAEAAATAVERGDHGMHEALLALDPNGDGSLSVVELRTIAERAFGRVDSDGDGRISPAEYQKIAERVAVVRMLRSAPRCDLPAIPDRARLVVYGGYEGDAISSAAVGGMDQETGFIDVAIEPGATPLYLILTSYESTVWKLSGSTDRVVRVVVSSQQRATAGAAAAGSPPSVQRAAPAQWRPTTGMSASGVIGIAADKVTIANSGCPRAFHDVKASDAAMTLATVRRALGPEADAVFASYSAQRVSLPSGTITRSPRDLAPLPRGFDAAAWRDAIRFWPGGLVPVDPRQVVATARVEPYKVLPSQMGLSQLIGAGAIERAAGAFRIVRPIARMPPGMGGAHSVRLIVAKGVPVPPGDPVHSCVIVEETGTPTGSSLTCGVLRP